VYSSMRLGVPFIAPRQLRAVESNLGRLILPSVDWRTGQSGAHRTLSSARFLSLNGKADRWQTWSLWRTGHVRCTPDSPVNYSRTSSVNSRERPLRSNQPGAPDTVRCTTGQSGAPRLSRFLAARAKTTSIGFFLFPALRHNTLVHKTMY
jgi:hypothetical protein